MQKNIFLTFNICANSTDCDICILTPTEISDKIIYIKYACTHIRHDAVVAHRPIKFEFRAMRKDECLRNYKDKEQIQVLLHTVKEKNAPANIDALRIRQLSHDKPFPHTIRCHYDILTGKASAAENKYENQVK